MRIITIVLHRQILQQAEVRGSDGERVSSLLPAHADDTSLVGTSWRRRRRKRRRLRAEKVLYSPRGCDSEDGVGGEGEGGDVKDGKGGPVVLGDSHMEVSSSGSIYNKH